jgi:hypothetical protein
MSAEKKILQIVAAPPGWYAEFRLDDGSEVLDPIANWVLVEDEGLRTVEGMCGYDYLEFAEDVPSSKATGISPRRNRRGIMPAVTPGERNSSHALHADEAGPPTSYFRHNVVDWEQAPSRGCQTQTDPWTERRRMEESNEMRLDTHEDMLRELIKIAAHQDRINDDLRAMMGRMDARMTEMEERQGRHERQMDVTIARLDGTLTRFDATLTRIDVTMARFEGTLTRLDTTLTRFLERGTNGRES